MYHDGSRRLQDRFDSRRIADRLVEVLHRTAFTDEDRAFIETRSMFFLATADAAGAPDCSYKGGRPGFVRVIAPDVLAFPNYDGNGMFITLGNVRETRAVALLFIDFESQKRLRVQGDAEIAFEDPLLEEFPEANLIVRVRVTQVFPNCPRYVHKRVLVERSRFVPKAGRETPEPGWKGATWAADVLPKKK